MDKGEDILDNQINKSLSVIIPALNEEHYVKDAIESIVLVLEQELPAQYEILVFDDGSTDKTFEIIKEVSTKNKNVKAFHHEIPQGLGSVMREGIRLSSKEYMTWFPGDYSTEAEPMRAIIRSIGKADVIATYVENNSTRSFIRQILSNSYTFILNILFCLRLKYYNGVNVFSLKMLKEFSVKTQGHSIFSELVIRALKTGHSYIELPYLHKPDSDSPAKAFSFKNILYVFKGILIVAFDIYIRRYPKG